MQRALVQLGGRASLLGSAAWTVIGEEIPLKIWSINHGLRPQEAAGVLIATLDVLTRHYGRSDGRTPAISSTSAPSSPERP